MRPYWNVTDQVYEADVLMFLGEKLIVPPRLRKDMLNLVYESHQGIDKANHVHVKRYTGLVWQEAVENTVNRCSKCAEGRRNNQKEPLFLMKFLFVHGKCLEQISLSLKH